MVLTVCIALMTLGTLSAASTLAIGSVNYYDFYDLESGDVSEYIPGLRLEYFFDDNFGLSADSIMIGENELDESREMVYIFDVVARLPLDPLEPYIGIGPTYRSSESRHDLDINQIAYNVRFGVDFIALDWLSFGLESNFLVEDVPEFFDTLVHSSKTEIVEAIRDYSLIGLTGKIRFN